MSDNMEKKTNTEAAGEQRGGGERHRLQVARAVAALEDHDGGREDQRVEQVHGRCARDEAAVGPVRPERAQVGEDRLARAVAQRLRLVGAEEERGGPDAERGAGGDDGGEAPDRLPAAQREEDGRTAEAEPGVEQRADAPERAGALRRARGFADERAVEDDARRAARVEAGRAEQDRRRDKPRAPRAPERGRRDEQREGVSQRPERAARARRAPAPGGEAPERHRREAGVEERPAERGADGVRAAEPDGDEDHHGLPDAGEGESVHEVVEREAPERRAAFGGCERSGENHGAAGRLRKTRT